MTEVVVSGARFVEVVRLVLERRGSEQGLKAANFVAGGSRVAVETPQNTRTSPFSTPFHQPR